MPILMYKGINLSGSGMSASSSLDDASENSVATTKLTNELNITKAPLESPVFTGTPEKIIKEVSEACYIIGRGESDV